MSLPDIAQLFGQRESSGILHVAPVDDISERGYPLAGIVFQPDRTHDFAIDVGGLLAAAQILHGVIAPGCSDSESNPATGAAAIEAQHQAGLFRRAAMVERIDAQRAMLADQPRRNLLDELEFRPPHQRPVAEDPQVFTGGSRYGRLFVRHPRNRYQNANVKRSGNSVFIVCRVAAYI